MLKPFSLKLAAALVLAGSAAISAQAQDAGALVDKLIKKGILTDQEGEEVRADMTRDFGQTNAGKINLSSSITELKLYGDFRYRYQYDERDNQVDIPSNVSQRSRHRFRLRLNADIELTNGFYAGFGIGSGQPSDSDNQTFENGFDDYNIFIQKAFLGWKPTEWLNITLGKFKNPFYTTELVWDSDINPQGLVEVISFHKLPMFAGSGGPTGDSSKDGKSFASSEVRSAPKWELTLVSGQFIFDDNGEFNLDSDLNTDAYLFVNQLIGTYKFNSNTSITFAPGFMTFTAADLSGLLNENAFTDSGDTTFAIPQTQTTTTERDRTVINYNNVTGLIDGGRVETRQITATQVSQPAVTVNGVSDVTRQTSSRDRITARRPLTAAQARTFAAANGLPQNVAPGTAAAGTGSATVDGDSVTVNTTSSTGTGLGAVSGETRQLHILTAPGDISFKLGGIKTKLYWDLAYNLGGRQRFEDIYQLYNGRTDMGLRHSERDSFAWLAGIQLGETKKAGDWQAYLNYRETGIASVDPNLNESDFALSELNTRGFKLGLAYAFTDAVVVNVTGMVAWNLNEDLVGGRATNAPAIAQDNASNILQVDFNVKF